MLGVALPRPATMARATGKVRPAACDAVSLVTLGAVIASDTITVPSVSSMSMTAAAIRTGNVDAKRSWPYR